MCYLQKKSFFPPFLSCNMVLLLELFKASFLKVLLLNRSSNTIPQNMMYQLNIVFQLRPFMRSGDHLKNIGRMGPLIAGYFIA